MEMTGILEILVPVLVAIVTGVIGPLLLFYMKQRSDAKKEAANLTPPAPEEAAVDAEPPSARVQSFLEDLRKRSAADRVYLMTMNPKVYNSESHLQRISVEYSDRGPGIDDMVEELKGLLATFFRQLLDRLEQGNILIYETEAEIDIDAVLRLWHMNGTRAMIISPVMTMGGKLIGLVGFDWIRNAPNMERHELEKLGWEATKLAGYLEHRMV